MPLEAYMTPEIIASFLTLTFLEIVLAGDNLVLIAILSGRLPQAQRPSARRFGLIAAVVTRLGLLVTLFWLAHLHAPKTVDLPVLGPVTFTPREIVLGIGGFFLIWKSFSEITTLFRHNGHAEKPTVTARPWSQTFFWTIVQIGLFDIVFSLDSVIAAIGIAQHVEVMAAAIITAAMFMLFLVNPISNFIDRHRVVRLIALNFLTLVGALLIAEAVNLDVPHIYFYAALAVAIVIQVLALWLLAWSPGAQRFVIMALVLIAIVGAFGAVLYLNRDTPAGHDAYAFLDQLWADVSASASSAYDWARSLIGSH